LRFSAAGLKPAVPKGAVHTDGARSGSEKVEKHEAVKDGKFAAVLNGPKAMRGVLTEVSYCHFSAQDEGDWPGEQADKHEKSADGLNQTRTPEQSQKRCTRAMATHAAEHSEEFLRSVQEKRECDHDAQQRENVSRCGVSRGGHSLKAPA
jgi:hypothetical protein